MATRTTPTYRTSAKSGRYTSAIHVPLEPEDHAKAKEAAKVLGVSLNEFCRQAIGLKAFGVLATDE